MKKKKNILIKYPINHFKNNSQTLKIKSRSLTNSKNINADRINRIDRIDRIDKIDKIDRIDKIKSLLFFSNKNLSLKNNKKFIIRRNDKVNIKENIKINKLKDNFNKAEKINISGYNDKNNNYKNRCINIFTLLELKKNH